MDIGDHDDGDIGGFQAERERPRALPADLPTSLNDRRSVPAFNAEMEMYDAWQGQSQFLTAPTLAKPLQFNLSLDEPDYGADVGSRLDGSDAKMIEMVAAQTAHRGGSLVQDEDGVVDDDKLSDSEKKDILQRALNMAASNGDMTRIERILNGKARDFVDLNAEDDEGTAPLIYASCFVSLALLLYGKMCRCRSVTDSPKRDTRQLSQPYSMPVQTWTSRTVINGAH